jgi:hypothetical protein
LLLPTDWSLWCSCGSSTYHSLQSKLEKRFSNGLSFLTSYTFSKAIDSQSNASLGFSNGGGERYAAHPEWEKGLADFDVRHRIVLSYSYELPFGHGKKYASSLNRGTNLLIGGWELQGVNSFQTGTPRTVIAANGVSNSDGEDRPDRVKGVSLVPSNQDPNNWINPAAFMDEAPGTFGNAGRNIMSTKNLINVDTSLFKDFALTERTRLQFRSEFFNLLNHANFRSDSLNTSFGSASFGKYSAARPSRQIQFALKLIF